MKKIQNLFIQHLRIMNDSEEIILKVLSSISKNTSSHQLRSFCEMRLQVQKETINRLSRVFELLKANPVGEKDSIVRSLIMKTNTVESNGNAQLQLAKIIFGRAMNVYQLNTFQTAVSCAEELYDKEIALLLRDCLNEIKFDKKRFDFLKEEEVDSSERNGLFYGQFVAA